MDRLNYLIFIYQTNKLLFQAHIKTGDCSHDRFHSTTTINLHLPYSTLPYSTVQYTTVQYSTVLYSTLQYITVQYIVVQYSTLQYSTLHNSTVHNQYITSTVQYSTVQYNTVHYCYFGFYQTVFRRYAILIILTV